MDTHELKNVEIVMKHEFSITGLNYSQTRNEYYVQLRSPFMGYKEATHDNNLGNGIIHNLCKLFNKVEEKLIRISGIFAGLENGFSKDDSFDTICDVLEIPELNRFKIRRNLIRILIRNSEQDAKYAIEQAQAYLSSQEKIDIWELDTDD